ncbi:MAG: hypothetical protein MUF63_16195 [Rhodobacteraceae bacterium]|nr:hypothetical protein [Paracoccaceae bacterium]
MKPIALVAALWLAALPAAAQEAETDEGMDLLSEGTRMLLEGLLGQMEPALRELQGMLGELEAYHPPEIQPNGDILIRRKTPEEMETPTPAPESEAEGIEL